MTSYIDTAAKAGDQVLSLVGEAQDAVVTTVATVSERVGGLIPELPTLPLTSVLPTPKELVDQGFSFAGRVLEAQKSYALGLVKAIEPISSKVIRNGKKTRKSPAKADATA